MQHCPYKFITNNLDRVSTLTEILYSFEQKNLLYLVDIANKLNYMLQKELCILNMRCMGVYSTTPLIKIHIFCYLVIS